MLFSLVSAILISWSCLSLSKRCCSIALAFFNVATNFSTASGADAVDAPLLLLTLLAGEKDSTFAILRSCSEGIAACEAFPAFLL